VRRSFVAGASIDGVDLVDTDMVIGPAGVEVGARLGPGEGSAREELGGVAFVLLQGSGGDVVLDELLLGEVKNLDAMLGGNDEPVELLGEEDGVDWGVAVVLGEPLALDDVPDHDLTVAGTGGEESGVLNDIKGGDLSLVTLEGVEQGHVKVVPDLDGLVPRGSNAKCGLAGVVETDNGNGVGVLVLVDGELALRAGVPDLDLLVKTSSDNLTIISGEGNGEDVSAVTDELGDGSSVCHVPQTDGTVPGGGEGEARITGELDLGDEVRVAGHHLLGAAPFLVLLFLTLGLELPLDEGLVTGAGEKEFLSLSVNLFLTDSEGSNPATVAYKRDESD